MKKKESPKINPNIYTNDRGFAAILQLRPNNLLLEMFVKDEIMRRKNAFITKEVSTKNGLDIYLTDKRFAVQVAKKLKKNFGGTIKQSPSLFTRDRQTSKLVYRLTVCFRLNS
ncbi:hypothetical protein CL617_04145 [archaeon]|jgi:nonsense-mediated mRNA decay protein 3|nr:hypothetical protein [archaeon]|tara:strand:- start:11666 stop:12004 length:339 start_codon:yes stop_codon:yes gene_type:complete